MPRRLPLRGGLAAIGLATLAGIGMVGLDGGPDPAAPSPETSPSPLPSAAPTRSITAPADPAARLAAAARAAFPDGLTGETEAGARIDYQPDTLVEAPFGPVLVSEGRVRDAAHADSGYVALHYLRAQGDAFALVRAFPQAVRTGSSGAVDELTVSDRFNDLPVVTTRGSGTWQGYSCGWTTLNELRPEGPVELVSFLDSYSNEGAIGDGGETTTGRIEGIVRGRSFQVRFTGTRPFVATYNRRGNRYLPEGGAASELQGC